MGLSLGSVVVVRGSGHEVGGKVNRRGPSQSVRAPDYCNQEAFRSAYEAEINACRLRADSVWTTFFVHFVNGRSNMGGFRQLYQPFTSKVACIVQTG